MILFCSNIFSFSSSPAFWPFSDGFSLALSLIFCRNLPLPVTRSLAIDFPHSGSAQICFGACIENRICFIPAISLLFNEIFADLIVYCPYLCLQLRTRTIWNRLPFHRNAFYWLYLPSNRQMFVFHSIFSLFCLVGRTRWQKKIR